MLDVGVKMNGYCSDMTRTVFLGKPTSEFREIYKTVRKAQLAALQEIRPGGPGLVSVLGGDVNSWSEKETVIRHLMEWYPESPTPTHEGTRGSYPTDHLFVGIPDGSGVTADYASFRVIPETYGSDHRGKLLILRSGDD